MLQNPFLQSIGPQGFNQEAPTFPQVDPAAANYNAEMRARELQTRMGISRMARSQQQAGLGSAAMLGAREAGKLLGTTLSSGTAAALGASSLPAEAAGGAIPSVAPQAGSAVLGAVGQGLGAAATAYGAYEANIGATKSLEGLQNAIDNGNLTPEEEAAAREKVFRAGMTQQNIGGLGGGLAGYSIAGPVGAVIGGAIGGSGGAREAWGSYDNNGDRWKAVARGLANPFRG